MYTGKSQCLIWGESFSEKQDRNQAAQYWSYKVGSQESPFQEELQPVQEAWGCTHHKHYQGLL